VRSVVQLHSGPPAVGVESKDERLVVVGGFSSVGRASALQAEGQRFESVKLHEKKCPVSTELFFDITEAKSIIVSSWMNL
jgi:hypothetical protein